MVVVGGSGVCSIISGTDRMPQVREGRGSQGVNMKTGPYGEEGFWSNGKSVSALWKQGETDKKKNRKHLVQHVLK